MGVQCVVLKDHGNVAVLRGDIIHQLAVDIQFAAADLLKARDHTQGRGFTAAGRTDQNDEFLVGNVKIEFLHGHDAFVGDLQIHLLLGFGVFFLFLLFAGHERVDLLDVLQLYSCHTTSSVCSASA